jgi:hypothetical protein
VSIAIQINKSLHHPAFKSLIRLHWASGMQRVRDAPNDNRAICPGTQLKLSDILPKCIPTRDHEHNLLNAIATHVIHNACGNTELVIYILAS